MTKDELIARLSKYEWNDIECKKAQGGVPDDAYKTVSAFANTAGGHLVFGVKDSRGNLEIVGVLDVDKVQNDFLSCLRTGDKLNCVIAAEEAALEHEDKTLLVFYIPEARRNEKPVYLGGDIRQSYIRRGAGDERCTPSEIERFLRDAADVTYDSERLHGLDVEECFDEASVKWYRRLFQEREEGRHADLSNVEFLHEFGFVAEEEDSLVPTRAGVLLFGKSRYVRQILPRAIVDYQRIDAAFENWSPEQRWHDRMVVEENIIGAWQVLVEKYLRLADRPFSVDSSSLRRSDDPPDYISFREAAINLLIHQDYGDHTRKPVVKMFADRSVFWNPGDAFATLDELLEPSEKEVRNPSIVSAFRRIGLSDQAGTGMRSIVKNWRQLGYVPPLIKSDKTDKTFEVALLKEPLLTEQQRLFQAQLGVHLSEQEADVFAYACSKEALDLTDAKSVLGSGNRDAQAILRQLVTQQLVEEVEEKTRWELASHLKDRFEADKTDSGESEEESRSLVSDQAKKKTPNLVTPELTKLSEQQKQILQLCEVPRKQAELMEQLGRSHRTFFRSRHLDPLIKANLLQMTHPDEPNHPDQAYVVTEAGLGLLSSWSNASEDTD